MTNSVMTAIEKLDTIRGRMSVVNLLQEKIDDLIAEYNIDYDPFRLESLMLSENLAEMTLQLENLNDELKAIRQSEKDSLVKQFEGGDR